MKAFTRFEPTVLRCKWFEVYDPNRPVYLLKGMSGDISGVRSLLCPTGQMERYYMLKLNERKKERTNEHTFRSLWPLQICPIFYNIRYINNIDIELMMNLPTQFSHVVDSWPKSNNISLLSEYLLFIYAEHTLIFYLQTRIIT